MPSPVSRGTPAKLAMDDIPASEWLKLVGSYAGVSPSETFSRTSQEAHGLAAALGQGGAVASRWDTRGRSAPTANLSATEVYAREKHQPWRAAGNAATAADLEAAIPAQRQRRYLGLAQRAATGVYRAYRYRLDASSLAVKLQEAQAQSAAVKAAELAHQQACAQVQAQREAAVEAAATAARAAVIDAAAAAAEADAAAASRGSSPRASKGRSPKSDRKAARPTSRGSTGSRSSAGARAAAEPSAEELEAAAQSVNVAAIHAKFPMPRQPTLTSAQHAAIALLDAVHRFDMPALRRALRLPVAEPASTSIFPRAPSP